MSIIEPHHTQGDLELVADVVVVGSGAGGATVAATLALDTIFFFCSSLGGRTTTFAQVSQVEI